MEGPLTSRIGVLYEATLHDLEGCTRLRFNNYAINIRGLAVHKLQQHIQNTQPGKLVAYKYRLLSMDYGLV